MDTQTANSFFTALTILANLALVAIVVVGVAALGSERGRRVARRLVVVVGPQARGLALLVAGTAMVGSLYYSEIAGFAPCELCWYQRIFMYPLALVCLVGVLRRESLRNSAMAWYAAPLVAIGAPISLYHWLVERVPAIAESSSCSIGVPCSAPYFEELGYVTLSFMALSAFCLVGALLVIDRAAARLPVKESA